MRTIDIHNRSIGLVFTPDQTAQVTVWAPSAKKVAVLLNDDSASLPLLKDDAGYWLAETDLVKPGDQYKFILNDEIECADPASLSLPQGIYGPSQAFNTGAFYWEDSGWVNPPLAEAIIYELDICTFTADGTLKAVVNRLRHLKRLGINTILLRPVIPFPTGQSQHRDGSFLFAVQSCYGGPYQLQQLINACHYEEIAVILDLACKQPSLQTESRSRGSLKRSVRQLQATAADKTSFDAWQHYLIENALMWFRDFHADALRLEGFHTLPDSDELLRSLRLHADALTAVTGCQYYLLIDQELPLTLYARQHLHLQGERYNDNGSTSDYQTREYQGDYVYDRQFASILQNLFSQANKSHTRCRFAHPEIIASC